MNDNKGFNEEGADIGGNMPLENSSSKTKLKEYGMKSIAPFADLFHRYKDDISPYLSALSKGLRTAGDSLTENDAERSVASWFQEASVWFDSTRQRIESSDEQAFLQYLEDESQKRPLVMFSASYVAGIFFGRLGKHMYRLKQNVPTSSSIQ